jgi:hypothetical protein
LNILDNFERNLASFVKAAPRACADASSSAAKRGGTLVTPDEQPKRKRRRLDSLKVKTG